MQAPFARTLIELVREQAQLKPEAVALVCTQGRFKYRDLAARAANVAGALHAAGVKRGDRVGLLLGNCVEWLDVCLGAGAVGATAVPLSTWSTRSELAFLLPDAKLSVLVASASFGDHDFEASLEALQGKPGVPTADRTWLVGGVGSRFQSFRAIVDAAASLGSLPPGQAASSGDDALVLYTSGSTSAPKAVPLRQFAVIENGFNIGERQGLTSADRVLLSSPLFWAFGSANAMPATFSHGATLVLMEKFDAALALQTIAREQCTSIYTLPAMSAAMAHHPSFNRQQLVSLRTGVTIGSPQEFIFAVDKLGITELCNIYGATETCGNCAVTWHHWPVQRRADCQGPPLPGQEIRLVDDATGVIVPDGTPGLAEVRGYTTLGYSGTSAAQNSKAFTEDGFYRTGDMGLLNTDGDFVFVGRVSEIIKRAGINVSPAEVESVLRGHPSVKEAAVVGVPDPARGERIFAYVVPFVNEEIDVAALMRYCATESSKYKVPDHIESCIGLPLTVTGKLQRNELKRMAVQLSLDLAALGAPT